MSRLALPLLWTLLLVSTLDAADTVTAGKTASFTKAALGLTVAATEVDIPAGDWVVSAVAPPKALEQVFVVPRVAPGEMEEAGELGRRMHAVKTERRIQSGRDHLAGLYAAIRDYAAAHGGTGPSAFGELDARKWGPLVQSQERSPWPEDAGKPVSGPFYFIVPGVAIPPETRRPIPVAPGMPLVLELRPYVDDGKHWVLLSDGRSERRPIDRALVARHGLTITFVLGGAGQEVAASGGPLRHDLVGLLRDPGAPGAVLTLIDRAAGRRMDVRWTLASAQPDGPELLGRWARARAREWGLAAGPGASPVLRAWTARLGDLYGASSAAALGSDAVGAPPRTTDAFSLLGGRAALRETLQMELLRSRAGGSLESPTIPLSTLKGVEVKAHPFDAMLAGAPGGRLPLADHVPVDRFFAYFARPSALFPAVQAGGDFLFRTGALFTRSAVDDDLVARYLNRLGLPETVARRFLDSGEVTELALVTPDLFFIDGTDVTVLMRVRQPDRVLLLMRTLGIADLLPSGITQKPLGPGRAAYWARQGDLLLVSTSRAELDGSLVLASRGYAGSLGRSAEFRYMLTQLPLKAETRVFAYFSDPFVRRMVGPAVKTGQLRRMRARAQMEVITAGALLFVLDGHRTRPDLATLARLGYVPASVAAGGYALRDDLSAVSPVWGHPAELAGLGAAPVETVTAAEAEAYRTYVDEYSRYWRQYFDPIALRLDDAPAGELELSTFILPLLDSELYDRVREVLAVRETGPALRVPVVTPDPVLRLSLNLTEEAWVKVAGLSSDLLLGYAGISPAIFDQLGPGLHVAIQDADPVIALGNADIFGSLAGRAFTEGLVGRGLPLLLSMLTRPCKIIVELRDEPAVLDILRRAVSGWGQSRREVAAEFRQVEGRDAWIYALEIPGILKMRLGIEVRSGYLILSNIPWSQPVAIPAVEARALNGAELAVAPGAVRLGLPGLFATQSEQSQRAALAGMAALYPLLLTVGATPEAAAARHAALFGWKPVHPGPGQWAWTDGRIESSAYGTPTRWKAPEYRPGADDFGLFAGIERFSVNMQLEAAGLRAVTRWLWKGR